MDLLIYAGLFAAGWVARAKFGTLGEMYAWIKSLFTTGTTS